jgi:nucleoside-diphosphate-sugar epimerase
VVKPDFSSPQEPDMTRALVFAGSSFVGQHLCRLLREKNVEVISTSRQPNDENTIACDLTCREDVSVVIEQSRPDWIIQCGAATASSSPRDHYAVHVTGALNVLEAAQEFVPDASILLFGSAAEYGPVPPEDLPVSETYHCRPTSYFGASKLAQTHLAQAAAATNGQRITIVRPFNIIGPGLPDHYFAAALAKRLLKQKADLEAGLATDRTFEVHNPDATRDFVDVRDVASAVHFLLDQHPPKPGQATVFNIATGQETPILEVARHLGNLAGKLTPRAAGQTASRADIVRSSGDPLDLIKSGWQALIPWQASLNALWQEVSTAITESNRAA